MNQHSIKGEIKMKVKGVLLAAVLFCILGGAAHGATLTLNLVTTAPSNCMVVAQTSISLLGNWTDNLGDEMFDELVLNPIQDSNGLEHDWTCVGLVEATIFWKDSSLGICQGIAKDAKTAVGICNGRSCTPKFPLTLGDYTVTWNNQACA